MAANIEGVLEESLQSKINNSKLLVVGAGGIGCEILKNLVLCGFSDIEIVSPSKKKRIMNNYINIVVCLDRLGHNRRE